jgi:alpha-tubulin suppressor-like RCC1 family protein
MALKTDGTVWAWGWNSNGELGNGEYTHSNTPVQVSGLTDVQAITAGAYHSLALKTDGTVWAWGADGVGQLGDGTNPVGYLPE